MTEHRQVSIEHEDQSAEVDKGIAPLVLALWQHGYVTFASCEGWSLMQGLAYVSFETGDEAERFYRLVRSVGVRNDEIARIQPSAELVELASDPAVAEDVAAKGGMWGVGFPSVCIAHVLRAVKTDD